MIGLCGASTEFRQHLASAIDLCLLVHSFDRKRFSDVRKEVLRVAKAAVTASGKLREMAAALTALGYARLTSLLHLRNELTASDRPPIEIDGLIAEAERLDCLAQIARSHADWLRSRDLGGRPKLFCYETLVRQLAAVYKAATGYEATVTWSPHRDDFGGPFVGFVEALLPKVVELARANGRPFEHPAKKLARGEYIKKTLADARTTRK